jgi:hypothetical protein
MWGRSENEGEPTRRKNGKSPTEQKSPPRPQSEAPSGEKVAFLK